jgi:TRAP-type C4-dicarboxylate transport system permease small subunit
LEQLKRFDEGIARGEAVLATVVLLSMIGAASTQAVFRNLAGWELDWANDVLGNLAWIDPFLQKGTLWLAFLGASLATREERHIGIDLLPRIAPKKVKLLMRGLANVASAVVAFYLSRAFWAAVLVNAEERPALYEVFGDTGPLHTCDAPARLVTDAGLEVPHIFCGVRSALDSIGVPVETPEAALQLIVPVAFVLISVRLLANGIGSFVKLYQGGDDEIEESHHKRSSELNALSVEDARAGTAGDESDDSASDESASDESASEDSASDDSASDDSASDDSASDEKGEG